MLPRWLQLVALVALIRVAVGLPGPWMAAQPADQTSFPAPIFIAIVLIFTITAGLLFFAGRNDRRARHLGVLFLLAAVPFTDGLLTLVAAALPGGGFPVLALRSLQVDAFIPYMWWVFVEDFPHAATFGRAARIPIVAQKITLALGVLLLGAHVLVFAADMLEWGWVASGPTWSLYRNSPDSSYYPILFLAVLPAAGFAVWKSGRARIEEQRRVRLLIAGILLGTLPTALIVILAFAVPAVRAAIGTPEGLRTIRLIAYPTLLALPLVTAYAVLVQRALDVRLVVRKAIQYALARNTVWTVAIVPFAALMVLLYVNRDSTLTEVLSGGSVIVLLTATAGGITAIQLRHRAFDAIDRQFFREQYDSRRLLHDVMERSRSVRDVSGLADLLTSELDRALHLEAASFCWADPSRGLLVSPDNRLRPLHLASELARTLADKGAPIEVDWELQSGPLHRLPQEDQQWLADGGFRLVVPLVDSKGDLNGLLGLGDKLSELPFSTEDRQLLASIAASASLTLENRLGPSHVETAAAERPASECTECGRVFAHGLERCDACGGPLEDASTPLVLAGKYRVLSRAGEGGMGVVYKGLDMSLGRDIAIKTLPRVSPALAQRLRREARAMAAVSHPNLATIFATEFWMGTPTLIVEYLPGGNLSDRLEEGPLDLPAAIDLGRTLADVVARIHDAGILHRDIKPTNIGFTSDGTAKLLDFGLARMFQVSKQKGSAGEARSEWGLTGPDLHELSTSAEALRPKPASTVTIAGVLMGTPLYMSPEAITGSAPNPSFDLWGISVVLYEAVAGRNPLQRGPLPTVLAQVVQGGFPDVRTYRPDAPPALAELLGDCLALDLSHRPATAVDLRRRLQRLQVAVAA